MDTRKSLPYTALECSWGLENVNTMILTKDPACTWFLVRPPPPESKAGETGQVTELEKVTPHWLLAQEKLLDVA